MTLQGRLAELYCMQVVCSETDQASIDRPAWGQFRQSVRHEAESPLSSRVTSANFCSFAAEDRSSLFSWWIRAAFCAQIKFT